MFPLPSLMTVAKYGFLSMVVTSAGFLIGNVVVMRHQKAPLADDLVYKPHAYLSLEDVDSVLDRDFGQCLTEPTKTFCLTSANETLRVLSGQERSRRMRDSDLHNTTAKLDHRHPIHKLLDEFSVLMTSLNVQPVLLEPSMLFCVLSPSNKFNLLMTREFNPNKLQGSRQVVTVGLFEKDARILDQEESRMKVSNAGFEVSRIQKWFINADLGSGDLHKVHFFFHHHSVMIHAMVFFERNTYLWHDGLSPEDFRFPDLLFVKSEIYENFTILPLNVDVDPRMKLTLPSDPVNFLFQIANSEFLYCQPQVDAQQQEVSLERHPALTGDQLVNRAMIAIQVLKADLVPHFVKLCLWTESLRGWFEACNIFHRTYELNLAASYNSVRSLNLSAIWTNSDYLEVLDHWLLEGMDLKVSLDCHGLRVNIFIFYVEDDVIWHYGNPEVTSVSDSHRFVYPKFRLCSTDVMGQKMYVPCETELIVKAEEAQTTKNVFSLS